LERLTVQRLSWDQIVRLHRYVELLGKLATAVWGGVRRVAGPRPGLEAGRDGLVELGQAERGRVRVGDPPAPLVFLAARSMLGFARWRLQRELWRRDVERLTSARGREPAS
jgi:hypothetical protein